MTFQYGGMREQICPPQYSAIAGNLTTSGTLYFWLQGRNDVGYNLPSTEATVAYTAGAGIRLTLPGDCLRDGENILQYSLTVNTVNDASSSKVLINLNQEDITLPFDIDLTEDAHLLIEETVTAFPTGADLVEGMLRQLNSTGLIYKYVPSSTLSPNGTTIIAATVGNWENIFDGFDSYVGNTTEDTNGANLNVLDITDSARILSKSYGLDGSAGPARTYWIRNETSSAITQGTRVGFTVSINGEPASEEFESLIKIVFNGYVDPDDGLLDITLADNVTPMDDVGVVQDYQFGRTNLILQKPLEPNIAYSVSVYPQFNSYELQSVPLTGTNISVLGFFFDEAGSFNDASAIIGNIILPENPNLRRVYPSSGLSVFADEGSGTVGGFFFKDIGSNTVAGLLNNQAAQTIVINNNGSVYLKDSAIESNEDLRALVSTVSGESITSAFSSLGVTADASPDLTVTVNYPTLIDPTYDDVIAGTSGKGVFNAEEIALYINNGTETRKFSGLAPTNTTSDSFTVSWSAGVVVAGVQTTSFGLWSPVTPLDITATTSGSVTYEAAVGFVYLGNSVTDISHKESDGAISELSLSISQIAEFAQYWRQPINSYADLRAIPSADLLDGQSHRIETDENEFEIWTWDFSSTDADDDNSILEPNDNPVTGRWIKMSGGGDDLDNVVTYNGRVVVDSDGFIVTSPLGGPIVTSLDDYLEDNIVGGNNNSITATLTLTEQSNKYQVFTALNGSDRTLNLYDGGTEFFREHHIINSDSTNNLIVEYPSGTNIDTLNPGEQLSVLWNTINWIIL